MQPKPPNWHYVCGTLPVNCLDFTTHCTLTKDLLPSREICSRLRALNGLIVGSLLFHCGRGRGGGTSQHWQETPEKRAQVECVFETPPGPTRVAGRCMRMNLRAPQDILVVTTTHISHIAAWWLCSWSTTVPMTLVKTINVYKGLVNIM